MELAQLYLESTLPSLELAVPLEQLVPHESGYSDTVKFWFRELKAERFECSIAASESWVVAVSDASAVAGAAYIESVDAESLAAEEMQWIAANNMFAQNWSQPEKGRGMAKLE